MNQTDFVVEYAKYYGCTKAEAQKRINEEILMLLDTKKGKKVFTIPVNNKKLTEIINYLIFLSGISVTKDGRNKKNISIYKA